MRKGAGVACSHDFFLKSLKTNKFIHKIRISNNGAEPPLKIDLVEYIAQRTPSLFVPRVGELLEAAYYSAFQHAETFEEPERIRVLGHLRHSRQNEAIRTAANAAGLVATSPHTQPKGDRYSMVAAQDIRFTRTSVPFNSNLPRPALHRKAIAALNARLEPVNMSLFGPDQAYPSDGLGCLIVTVNPPRTDNQSLPAAILVGVPYTNLRGWHLLEPLSTILAAQNPAEQIDVPDLAWAKLKKQLGDAEG